MPRSKRSPVLTVGIAVAVIGAMWILFAVLGVIRDVYVLWHLDGYRAATAIVTKVNFLPARGEQDYSFDSTVVINGETERVGLAEFIGIPDTWLAAFSGKWPRTKEQAQAHFRSGDKLEVMYNPGAPNIWVCGQNLRVLKNHADFQGYYKKALGRDAAFAFSPFLVGCTIVLGSWLNHKRKAAGHPGEGDGPSGE